MMYDDHQYISFVELKGKVHDWASEVVEQLKTTICIVAANHRIEDYQHLLLMLSTSSFLHLTAHLNK